MGLPIPEGYEVAKVSVRLKKRSPRISEQNLRETERYVNKIIEGKVETASFYADVQDYIANNEQPLVNLIGGAKRDTDVNIEDTFDLNEPEQRQNLGRKLDSLAISPKEFNHKVAEDLKATENWSDAWSARRTALARLVYKRLKKDNPQETPQNLQHNIRRLTVRK